MQKLQEVIDPPNFGFDVETIEETTQKAYKHNLIVQLVENSLNLRTSTPLSKKKHNWDAVVEQHYLQVMKMSLKTHSSDSGYASNNHESNSSTHADICSYEDSSIPKFVYVNEDTLLEQPINQTNSNDSRVEASVSSSEYVFRALKDTEESGISNASDPSSEIVKMSPIVVTTSNRNKRKFCEISDDSFTDNHLNFQKNCRGSTLLELSLCKSVETNEIRKADVQLMDIAQTPDKSYKNLQSADISPDLFSEEETVDATQAVAPKLTYKEKYLLRQDRKLLRRAQDIMIGVSPPPCVTYVQISVEQLLEKVETNKHLFLTKDDVKTYRESSENKAETFLLTENGKDSTLRDWPEVLQERFHGLHYNRNKTSEELEQLAMKYSSKYIGCETQSFCTVFQTNRPTPSKNANRLRWAIKSPGKRLSHLARRRITFSSANLQSQTRQVAIDPRRLKLLSRKKSPIKKSPRKTPRKTPSKKSPAKKIRTPSSSAKKRLSMQLRIFAEQMPSTSKVSATKRALFQSPEKKGSTSQVKGTNSGASTAVSASPFKRRASLKCALFASPTKQSPSKAGCKRKRTDSDTVHPAKLPRSLSLQENAISCNSTNKGLSRFRSEVVLQSASQKVELSANHKKKLQWAIFEALRSHNIGMSHPEFKKYASVLVRVTRKYLPNLSASAPRPECGTSERMLRIARQHVGAVIAGRTVEEIISDYERGKLRNSKPTGYVSVEEEAKRMDVSDARTNVLRDMANIPQIPKPEVKKLERIDKVRKIINFDDDNSVR